MSKEQIRNAIFLNKDEKKEIINAFGIDLELRRPSLGKLLSIQDSTDSSQVIIQALINCCYVPGTEEHIFDEADADSIAQLPFDENMQKVQEGINVIMGFSVSEEKKD